MPRTSLWIGLTGGLGAGKSTVLRELARLGAAVVSADRVALSLSAPGQPVAVAVQRLFGPGSLAADGSVDRSAVARRAFSDPAARRRLEAAVHPSIVQGVLRVLSWARRPVAVAEVPLLFEAGLNRHFDLTVTVSASRSVQLTRLKVQGAMSRAQALQRMRAQWPLGRKERAADVVLLNDGSRAELRGKARAYYRSWELMAQALRRAPILGPEPKRVTKGARPWTHPPRRTQHRRPSRWTSQPCRSSRSPSSRRPPTS